jgi:hypothetical protein
VENGMGGLASFERFPWKSIPGSDIALGTGIIRSEVDPDLAPDCLSKNLNSGIHDLGPDAIARYNGDLVTSCWFLARLGSVMQNNSLQSAGMEIYF